MTPLRDRVRTIGELPFAAAETYGDRPALRARRDGVWADRSFTELADTVRDLARGLVAEGIAAGDRVCVLAETRPEWTYAGLAVLAAGGVLVPIYPSSSAEECEWVIGNSGARMVVCEDAGQLAKVERMRDRMPDLAVTVVIAEGGLSRLAAAGSSDVDGELTHRRATTSLDAPAQIIYTSGTTGPPKGCVLTHRNWLTLCEINERTAYVRPADVVYLFLPLAHVFAQITQFACLDAGATLAYYGGDLRRIVPELAEVAPTFLPSVPRIFEKVHTALTGGDVRDPVALSPAVRALFGGRLRMALSGAAPISPEVLEFFAAAGVPVLEGYGMTETTGVGTINTLEHHRLGTVGVAAPGTRIRVADDGEVLMSGPHVFAGYWRDPAATAEVLVDGWVRTGDVGALDADGFLTITGRKKDIIITAGGKNIAPANLENDLRQSRWISHAIVYGDRRPYPVALLTLDPEEILPWARDRGLPADLALLAGSAEVRDLLQRVVDDVNGRYARAARIKRFAVLDRDLTQEFGELTPTLKVKRAAVHANHAAMFYRLYEGDDDGRG
ncbi:MAG TPA: AMP-dependent synthetase/ligase [Micromonosporaceae bacterium]|jgi:long-chain acyl-CoA synthetase